MPDEVKPSVSQLPASNTSAQIFTMPEQYRHGKEVKLVEPEKEQKSTPTPVAPSPPPPPKLAAPVPPHLAKKQNHNALIVAGVIVLLALIIGSYLLLRSQQKQTPQPEQEQPAAQPVTRPAVEEEATEEIEETIEETENPFVAEIVPGKDSDSDGLSDLEESDLYQTNQNLPDTDADGFLDGNEVFHRYNPSGTAPGTLLEAGKVRIQMVTETIQLAHPTGWSVTEPTISFTTNTGEIIYVSTQTSLSEWITAQGGQEQVHKSVSKSGFDLYLTQDKRHALMVVADVLLEFRYELGTKTTIDYLQTFQMMLNSVVKTP